MDIRIDDDNKVMHVLNQNRTVVTFHTNSNSGFQAWNVSASVRLAQILRSHLTFPNLTP